MPNHITNVLTLKGDQSQIDSLVQSFGTYIPEHYSTAMDGSIICSSLIDGFRHVGYYHEDSNTFERRGFDSVTGIPEGFNKETSPAIFHFPDFEKVITPPDDPAYRDEPTQREAEKSPNWWYTWNNLNWGTKWNSYTCEQRGVNKFKWETAWNPSVKIVAKMSAAYPELEFNFEYADEDLGYNCGWLKIQNGKILSESNFDPGSIEAYDFCFTLMPDQKDHYAIEDGRYKYME